MKRSDIQIVNSAIQQRWPIEPEWREACMRQLIKASLDPSLPMRVKIRAIETLMKADQINQAEDEREEQANENRNRFSAIAESLGIIGSVKQLPAAGADSDREGTQDTKADDEG